MNIISLNKFIDSKGLIIKPEDINEFINSSVRITIEKVSDYNKKSKILDFAGSLNDEDAEVLRLKTDECRQIDLGTW